MTLTTIVNLSMWLVGLAGIAVAVVQAARLFAGSRGGAAAIFEGPRHRLAVEDGSLCMRVNLERDGGPSEFEQLLTALDRRAAEHRTAALSGLRDEIDVLKRGESRLDSIMKSATNMKSTDKAPVTANG